MTFSSGSIVTLNNSALSSSSSDLYWGWNIATGNYIITNNNISNNGLNDGSYGNTFTASTGGLIYENIFLNCNLTQCITLKGASTGLNLSSNIFPVSSNAGV